MHLIRRIHLVFLLLLQGLTITAVAQTQSGSTAFVNTERTPSVVTQDQSGFTAEFVNMERTPAAVYRPAGNKPHIGVIYLNGASSMTMLGCTELARRGFVMVCTPGSDISGQGGWERVALDVKHAVNYLRQQPGIAKVVLYAHSGGGAVASFYQAVAENGVAFCQDPKKLSRCSDELANLPPVDGMIYPDAHPGLGVMDTRDLNPSVVIDGLPRKLRIVAALDPYNPKNGFNPNGPSSYPLEFQQRYAKAQAERMNALIDQAISVRKQTQDGNLQDPTEDRIAYAGFALGATHLDELDPNAAGTMSSIQPRRLLKNDGSIVTQIIKSAAVSNYKLAPKKIGVGSVRSMTVAYFLSRGSVRGNNSIDGPDWCSSNSVTVCNTGVIHVPSLFMPSGAGTFITDMERMFERSPAKDKEYIVIEGSTHGATSCTACETTPGQYSNATKNTYDYMAGWMNSRF